MTNDQILLIFGGILVLMGAWDFWFGGEHRK